MTLVPQGAKLAAVDLPPPPPASDPREPSTATVRGRGTRTPQRARSPAPGNHSRSSSPSRPPVHHHASSTDSGLLIAQPVPRPIGSISPGPLQSSSFAHLSRPSSPSSICSSSSAIFERDIEIPPVVSLSLNPNATAPHTLSHKSSRLSHLSHGSPLDHTVPAALDDAVEALTDAQATSRGIEGLEIEAPAPTSSTGMARQSSASLHNIRSGRKISTASGSGGVAVLNSRSPSPVSIVSRGSSGVVSPAQSPPILGQLATQQAQAQALAHSPPFSAASGDSSPVTQFGGSVPRPAMPQRISTGPQLPGGWAFSNSQSKVDEELAKQELPPPAEDPSPSPTTSTAPAAALPSHLTPTKDKRRISFISYNDLLRSVPTTVTPLGEITSGALSPDHLPGTVSPNPPTRSPVMSNSALSTKEVEHKSSWDASNSGRAAGGLGFGDGEWSREGLGKGLEQRLESLAREESLVSTTSQVPASPTPAAGVGAA